MQIPHEPLRIHQKPHQPRLLDDDRIIRHASQRQRSLRDQRMNANKSPLLSLFPRWERRGFISKPE